MGGSPVVAAGPPELAHAQGLPAAVTLLQRNRTLCIYREGTENHPRVRRQGRAVRWGTFAEGVEGGRVLGASGALVEDANLVAVAVA